MVGFRLFSDLWGPPGLGLKASPRTVTFTPQDISPGYLQYPRVMRRFWFLNFDARILILMFEWSVGRSDEGADTDRDHIHQGQDKFENVPRRPHNWDMTTEAKKNLTSNKN